MQKYSDAELVALYLESRGPQFLTELFTRHSNIVYRTALRIMKNPADAEDIMQTVYCKLISSLHLYKATGSVIGWMLQIVIHTCYNQLQSEKSRTKRDTKIMSERNQTVSPRNDELKEIMEAHLNKLPDIYKVPITLQIMEGLTIKEVSEALEIPEKTIRSQIARGLEKLKVSLQNFGITASIIMIGDSLKQIPLPVAPASINSNAYFQSLIKNKAAASTKLAVVTSSNSILMKLVSFIVVASISVVTYLNWPILSRVDSIKNEKQWDFENSTAVEEYQGIRVVKGAISIVEGRGLNDSKCLQISENTVLEIDISEYALPIAVSYELDVLEKESIVNQILFDDTSGDLNKKLPFFSGLRERLDLKPSKSVNKKLGFTGNWFNQISYIDTDSYDCWVNGKRSHLLLGASIDQRKIYLLFYGKTLIDNFKIESIAKGQLPDKTLYQKVALNYSYQDGIVNHPIETTKIGLSKKSSAKPYLKYLSTSLKSSAPSYSSSVIYPRLSENGKVEWNVKREFQIREWSFENNSEAEPYQDIALLKGDIQIVEKIGIQNSKALQINEESLVALNISKFQLPIKVSYKIDLSIDEVSSMQRIFLSSYKNTEIKELSELRERISINIGNGDPKNKVNYSGNWFHHEFFIDENAVDFWINNSRSHLLIGESSAYNEIFLYIGGKSKIDDLKIESIKKEDMPNRSVCENLVNEIKEKKIDNAIEIDKAVLGLSKESKAVPNIKFRRAEYFEENFDLKKTPVFATLGDKKLVEWIKTRQKVSKKWEFEMFKELLDFKLVSGSIFLEKNRGENNSNCLAIDAKTIFSIDISEFQLPLKITLKYDIVLPPNSTDSGVVVIKSELSPDKNVFNFTNLAETKLVDVSKTSKNNKNQNSKVGFIGEWMTKVIYVSDECVDIWNGEKRSGLTFQTSLDNKKLYFLNFDPTIFDSVIFETIENNQIPPYDVYKNFAATTPFNKGMRTMVLDKKTFGIDEKNKPKVDIYDREFLEVNLQLNTSKAAEVMVEKDYIDKANNIFQRK